MFTYMYMVQGLEDVSQFIIRPLKEEFIALTDPNKTVRA